jgi:hypothetical protein
MRSVRRYVVVLLLVSAASCGRADQEFYHRFLRVVDTNDLVPRAVKSPFLIDPNNATPRLTNQLVSLSSSKTNGRIADVQLGMTMENVVAAFGKPHNLWSRCYGGPLFCYVDVTVGFEPRSNSVRRIAFFGKSFPLFEPGLSASSSIADFLRVLGTPSTRKDHPEDTLIYETPFTTMRLYFRDNGLSLVELERCSDSAKPKK